MTPRKLIRSPAYNHLGAVTTSEQTVNALKGVIRRLTEIGAGPPPNSRLHQALEVLSRLSNSAALRVPGSKERRLIAEAQRMTFEFWMIANTLHPKLVRNRSVHRKLHKAYGGPIDPMSLDLRGQAARDYQHELWLGSWFAMGGRPTMPAEPDLNVTLWFEWYGVAAKRVRSRSKILERVREAASQIRKHSEHGIIALSLDNYSHRRGRRADGVEAGDRFFKGMSELDVAEDWLTKHAPWVKVMLSFAALASWKRRTLPPQLELSNLTRITLLCDGIEYDRMLESFDDLATTYTSRFRPRSSQLDVESN